MQITAGGLVNSITNGGFTAPLAGLKILYSAGVTSGNWGVFYDISPGKPPATPYQVPVGKTFQVLGFRTDQMSTTAANNGTFIGYADTNPGASNASPPTNPIGVVSGISPTGPDMIDTAQVVGSNIKSGVFGGQAPAGKYMVNQHTQACLITLFGVEI